MAPTTIRVRRHQDRDTIEITYPDGTPDAGECYVPKGETFETWFAKFTQFVAKDDIEVVDIRIN